MKRFTHAQFLTEKCTVVIIFNTLEKIMPGHPRLDKDFTRGHNLIPYRHNFLICLFHRPKIRDIEKKICIENSCHCKSTISLQPLRHDLCADDYPHLVTMCRPNQTLNLRSFPGCVTVKSKGSCPEEFLDIFLNPLCPCAKELHIMSFTPATTFRHLCIIPAAVAFHQQVLFMKDKGNFTGRTFLDVIAIRTLKER